MGNNLLFGYYSIGQNNIWDFGNDPYFHSKPFSWGICRPNNRSKVEYGTKIFFYTFKESAGDYYLTGMMKVDRILTQIEASNDVQLYCGKEKDKCPYQLKDAQSINCFRIGSIEKRGQRNAIAIKNRDCRCNIIVNKNGDYKKFCDGGNHMTIYQKYLNKKIYFVSTVAESIATKNKIRILDYISGSTKFWQFGRYFGYELSDNLSNKFENILSANEFKV